MDSSDLNPEQCRIIGQQLGPSLRYTPLVGFKERPPYRHGRRDRGGHRQPDWRGVHRLLP